MEAPKVKLVNVKSAAITSEELYEEEERILQQVENTSRASISVEREISAASPEVCKHEDSATESIQRTPSNSAKIFMVETEPDCMNPRVKIKDIANTLQSTSTALAEEEARSCASVACGEGISQILDWFKSTFTEVSKNGKVTLRDMKQAAKTYEVVFI